MADAPVGLPRWTRLPPMRQRPEKRRLVRAAARYSSRVDAKERQSGGRSARPPGSWQAGHGTPGPGHSSCGHGRSGCASQIQPSRQWQLSVVTDRQFTAASATRSDAPTFRLSRRRTARPSSDRRRRASWRCRDAVLRMWLHGDMPLAAMGAPDLVSGSEWAIVAHGTRAYGERAIDK
jgi:hypothetical protein